VIVLPALSPRHVPPDLAELAMPPCSCEKRKRMYLDGSSFGLDVSLELLEMILIEISIQNSIYFGVF
jgi:hypothetical protein